MLISQTQEAEAQTGRPTNIASQGGTAGPQDVGKFKGTPQAA